MPQFQDCRDDIADLLTAGQIDAADIAEQTISNHLYTAGLPDPDLLIRTASEMRISNYLLWQISYAELYVADVCWPDFAIEHLDEALRAYTRRQRKYGSVPDPKSR